MGEHSVLPYSVTNFIPNSDEHFLIKSAGVLAPDIMPLNFNDFKKDLKDFEDLKND